MLNDEQPEAGTREAGRAGPLSRALRWLDRVTEVTVVSCMAALVSIVTTQVILRYFFNSSLDWAWEASRLAFVASIFFAIPLALREGAHVGIDILQQMLPKPVRYRLMAALNSVVIALMMIVTIVGFQATRSTWDQTMSSLPISTGWFYVPVLWAGVHCSLHLLRQGVLLLRNVDPFEEAGP